MQQKKNIYEQRYKIKKIYINGFSSDFFFTCNGCVRQGEKLSPLLFSLYNNDLEDYLLYKNVAALFTITERIKKEHFFIFKNVYLVLCRRHCYFS